MKHPEQEELLEETYDELEAELTQRIAGIQHQIEFASDKRNTIIRINRVAKTAIDVFNDILEKPSLDRNNLNLMIEKIRVFEDHIEVQLKADIDSLLRTGALPEDTGNFKSDTEVTTIRGSMWASTPRNRNRPEGQNHEDKVFRVSVISSGDPLEIYTEKDGEVIFKKYFPDGRSDGLRRADLRVHRQEPGHIAAVSDRDAVICGLRAAARAHGQALLAGARAAYGGPKNLSLSAGAGKIYPSDATERYYLGVSAPILSEGDLMGCVMLLLEEQDAPLGEAEQKLVQTVAGFLGRQMEN